MSQRRLNRRQLLAGLAGIAGMGHTLPARAQEPTPAIRRGGVPLVALPRLPERPLAPNGDGWGPAWLCSLIYDAPLRVSAGGAIVPGCALAAGFNADRTAFMLTPRPDALYPDGTPVTAVDIADSIARARERASGEDAWRWEHVVEVAVIAAGQVRVALGQPDATLPATLASWGVPVSAGEVVPEAAVPDLPPGSGPFVPSASREGRIHLRANRVFRDIGLPRFDGVDIVAVSEPIERTARLVSGAIDVAPDVPPLDIPLLEGDPGNRLHGGISRRACAIVLNLRRPPLNDVRVRRLLAGAIDRMALVDGATAGTAQPVAGLIPPEHWAGDPDAVLPVPAPVAETRARLADLELRPGWPLRIACPDDAPTLANTAILLQEQLGAAGVAVGIDLLAADALAAARDAGDFDLLMVELPQWVDPHELVHPWLHSAGSRNVGGFASVRIDRQLALARATTREEQRGRWYADIQRIVAAEVPLIPLFALPWYDGVRSRIAGYGVAMPPSGRGLVSAWFPRP